MKKNSFIEGTLIATLSIIIVKILGIIYVIPFYAIVGSTGASLYAYAYNIYGLFLEIATAGIPNAVAKLINELHVLGSEEAKIRTFKIGKRLLSLIAVIAFLIMFLFARNLATLILDDLQGGNSIEDVTFVIRCVSFALLIFPFLSVSRGFFQGHRIISVSSISQVIEQLARVIFIVAGSYIAVKWLKLDMRETVGIAVFSAFVGGACALLYVRGKLKKHKKELGLAEKYQEKDPITNKDIIKKILKYAIPAVIISISLSIYNNVDMILILRTMDHLGFEATKAEFISTAISTWASKISIIVTSIGLGLSSSLVPAMVEAYTLKDYKEVNHKFNKAVEITFFITVPMCVGISLLSSAIWTVFYGYNSLGANILAISIFSTLFSNLFTIANYTLQSMNRFRLVYTTAITGIITNAVLDVPLMLLCNRFHIPAYYGATFATILGFGLTLILTMMAMKKDYHFEYKEILHILKKMILPLFIMIAVVLLLKLLIPSPVTNRFYCILYIGFIAIIGASIYFLIAYKLGLIDDIFGSKFLNKIKNKWKKRKDKK